MAQNTVSCSNVEDVLRVISNRTTEGEVLSLRSEVSAEEVSDLCGFELLLVA